MRTSGISFLLAASVSSAICIATPSAHADEEVLDRYALGVEVLAGYTHVYDVDGTAGNSKEDIAAIGVRASKRFDGTHFVVSASYIHHTALSGTSFAGPYQYEWLGVGAGYELGIHDVLVRPELLIGLGAPHQTLKDTNDNDGAPDTSIGLAFGGGVGIRYPSVGRWYFGLDGQTIYKSRDQGPLWLFSAYASLGIRFAVE